MAKIEYDKYYTSDETSKYVVAKTLEVIGVENITELVEPSAGAGAILRHFPASIPSFAIDLKPECEGVIEADFLSFYMPPKRGRCFIGNPPFGTEGDLMVQFYKHMVAVGDYIALVLPISQLDNPYVLFEFDLVHSENLGVLPYSGVELHCCFNIYKRPVGMMNNPLPKDTLKGVKARRLRAVVGRPLSEKYKMEQFDMVICTWGDIGKIATYIDEFAATAGITVIRKELKECVLEAFRWAYETKEWEHRVPGIAARSLPIWKINSFLRDMFPELRDKKGKGA